MRKKRMTALLLAAVMLFAVTGCVNQHPEGTAGNANTAKESGEVRLGGAPPPAISNGAATHAPAT